MVILPNKLCTGSLAVYIGGITPFAIHFLRPLSNLSKSPASLILSCSIFRQRSADGAFPLSSLGEVFLLFLIARQRAQI